MNSFLRKHKRRPKMKKKEEYKFWKGSCYNRSFAIIPKDMIVNNEEILNEIKPEITWVRSDTETKVIPGFRYKVFGAMAEKIHKLVMNGCNQFKVEKCRMSKDNFIAKNGFEVPNYNLIIDRIKLIQ
jgi:hypothetical protein